MCIIGVKATFDTSRLRFVFKEYQPRYIKGKTEREGLGRLFLYSKYILRLDISYNRLCNFMSVYLTCSLVCTSMYAMSSLRIVHGT